MKKIIAVLSLTASLWASSTLAVRHLIEGNKQELDEMVKNSTQFEQGQFGNLQKEGRNFFAVTIDPVSEENKYFSFENEEDLQIFIKHRVNSKFYFTDTNYSILSSYKQYF